MKIDRARVAQELPCDWLDFLGSNDRVSDDFMIRVDELPLQERDSIASPLVEQKMRDAANKKQAHSASKCNGPLGG
jgi:hypothetical protein